MDHITTALTCACVICGVHRRLCARDRCYTVEANYNSMKRTSACSAAPDAPELSKDRPVRAAAQVRACRV